MKYCENLKLTTLKLLSPDLYFVDPCNQHILLPTQTFVLI